ncbi:MAG: Tyrosine-specific transport protein [Chlamydiia bacterium]|nr:Tyrosine-specific transport protein [Chlamydiia bacterium]
MKDKQPGSILGGSLLISGSCIGAGMLGLPILTGFAGLFPSMIMFFLAWALMTATALLLVEASSWFAYHEGFPTMIGTLLGSFFRALCVILFLILFYSLLVAYIADSGIHTASAIAFFSDTEVKTWACSTVFVVLFGWMIYLGTRSVDILNRFLMIIKITAFVILLLFSIRLIDPSNFLYTDLKYTFFPLPILIISFGFHNMIPTITHYMKGDITRVRHSILLGSIITLSIYILWIFVTLGSLPINGDGGIAFSYRNGLDAAAALNLLYPSIATPASLLAFAAILTSFLAQSISITHFFCDGLKLNDRIRPPIGIILLTLIPPLVVAQWHPEIFYKALSFGGIIAVILFGLFPVMMVYKGRYLENRESSYKLFGGKVTLLFLFSFSLFIVISRLLHHHGIEIFPIP